MRTAIDTNNAASLARIARKRVKNAFVSAAADFAQQPNTDHWTAMEEAALDHQHATLNLSNADLAKLVEVDTNTFLFVIRQSRKNLHARLGQ